MTTKAEYEVIDTIADQCISAANAVGPTLRGEWFARCPEIEAEIERLKA